MLTYPFSPNFLKTRKLEKKETNLGKAILDEVNLCNAHSSNQYKTTRFENRYPH